VQVHKAALYHWLQHGGRSFALDHVAAYFSTQLFSCLQAVTEKQNLRSMEQSQALQQEPNTSVYLPIVYPQLSIQRAAYVLIQQTS
jgi:hypothetical protein